MKECKNTVCFGPGFRKSSVVRSVSLFPSQRPEEIALQVDPIESFRFEKVTSTNGDSYRIRSNASIKIDSILGYNPRYFNLKTNINRIHGAFTTTLKDWVAPIDDSFLYNKLLHTPSDGSLVQWPFFKVNPNTLDDIFAVKADSTWETDQFLVNAYVGCKVVRLVS